MQDELSLIYVIQSTNWRELILKKNTNSRAKWGRVILKEINTFASLEIEEKSHQGSWLQENVLEIGSFWYATRCCGVWKMICRKGGGEKKKAENSHLRLERVYEIGNAFCQLFSVNGTQRLNRIRSDKHCLYSGKNAMWEWRLWPI